MGDSGKSPECKKARKPAKQEVSKNKNKQVKARTQEFRVVVEKNEQTKNKYRKII
jgi:hypothetical protein